MGKGSSRREFDKKRERAFKKRYGRTYRSKTSAGKPSQISTQSHGDPRTVYLEKNGKLVPKPPKGLAIEIQEPEGAKEHRETWKRFVDKLDDRHLRQLANVASVTATHRGIE